MPSRLWTLLYPMMGGTKLYGESVGPSMGALPRSPDAVYSGKTRSIVK
jgi:hypothetical protein